MSNSELALKIHGRVQGVFFRGALKQWAQELELVGYAKNCSDGSVHVRAQGSKHNLVELKRRCYAGSQHAQVSHVDEQWNQVSRPYKSFSIEY